MLRLLSVVVISCAEEGDRQLIMDEAVEFRDFEMLLHTKVHKNGLILMKHHKSVVKTAKCLCCLRWKLYNV